MDLQLETKLALVTGRTAGIGCVIYACYRPAPSPSVKLRGSFNERS